MGRSEGNAERAGGRGMEPAGRSGEGRAFLSVWYRCCHTYGRLYRNHDESAYVGRCPRCGARAQARIGADGTARRVFEAR